MSLKDKVSPIDIETVLVKRNGEEVPVKVARATLVRDLGEEQAVIGQTTDGDWFTIYDGIPVQLFRTKWDLAAHLWKDGNCGLIWSEFLLRLGWLRVDPYAGNAI
jgi:hypothetical protein